MIISHKHKFIFIRVPKTASTSIQLALGKICGPDDIVTAFFDTDASPYHHPRNNAEYGPHTAARKIKRKISPEIWDSYFKFAFERNPFDKVVSRYHMKILKSYDKSFKEFCLECAGGVRSFVKGIELYSIDGKIVVDFIGKYENLNEDFNFVCDKLNLPKLELTRERARSRKESDYRKYYDDESRRLVEEHFAREIKLFNYKF